MPMSQKVFTLRAESAKVKRNFMVTMYVVHHGCRVQLVELECQHIAASYSHGASSLEYTVTSFLILSTKLSSYLPEQGSSSHLAKLR